MTLFDWCTCASERRSCSVRQPVIHSACQTTDQILSQEQTSSLANIHPVKQPVCQTASHLGLGAMQLLRSVRRPVSQTIYQTSSQSDNRADDQSGRITPVLRHDAVARPGGRLAACLASRQTPPSWQPSVRCHAASWQLPRPSLLLSVAIPAVATTDVGSQASSRGSKCSEI